MLFTLDMLMEMLNIKLEDTVYAADEPGVRQYVISSGNFYEAAGGCAECEIYKSSVNQSFLDGETAWYAPDYYMQRLAEINDKLKLLKNDKEDKAHIHADEIRVLRKEKKRIAGFLENKDVPKKQMIQFKNSLYAVSFGALCRYIPEFAPVNFRDAFYMPWFVAGMTELKKVLLNKRPLAISGGPCLFGVHEMLIKFTLDDGCEYIYDFSSGRHFMEDDKAVRLDERIGEFGSRVRDIVFVRRKTGVTTQEYDSIHCLFECADALHAKLTIPLPDMSYIKYMENILSFVPETIRNNALDKFRQEAFAISDMYLMLIEKMKHMYPCVHVAVIHERDEKLCSLFYEKRKKYLTETTVRRLTDNRIRRNSIQDYITMPALPYYLWEITDIIQMDSLDEADSYRKCAKIHKNRIKLYGMLYPERISKDGVHTIFFAPLEYKEYISGR